MKVQKINTVYMYWGTEDKASDSRWKILVVGSATMRKC